jgi:hypothetical protein
MGDLAMGRGTRAREVRAPAAREYRRRSPQSCLPAGVVEHAGAVGNGDAGRRGCQGDAASEEHAGRRRTLARGWH